MSRWLSSAGVFQSKDHNNVEDAEENLQYGRTGGSVHEASVRVRRLTTRMLKNSWDVERGKWLNVLESEKADEHR